MSTADHGPDRCDCKRSSADAIESAAWTLVVHELTDPDRLQQLAGLAASLPEPGTDSTEDVIALDRKIKRLEAAFGSQIADLIAGGLDSDAVRAASPRSCNAGLRASRPSAPKPFIGHQLGRTGLRRSTGSQDLPHPHRRHSQHPRPCSRAA